MTPVPREVWYSFFGKTAAEVRLRSSIKKINGLLRNIKNCLQQPIFLVLDIFQKQFGTI